MITQDTKVTQEMRQYVSTILKKLPPFPDTPPNIPDVLVLAYYMALEKFLNPKEFTPLSHMETAIVTEENQWKTAALCYDRVWGVPVGEIGFVGRSDIANVYALEKSILLILHAHESGMNLPPELQSEIPLVEEHYTSIVGLKAVLALTDGKLRRIEEIANQLGYFYPKWLSNELSNTLGRPVFPSYSSNEDRERAYEPGNHHAVIAILNDLNVVSEKELSWDQVFEFRKDSESRKKYRRFIHWLDSKMVDKSLAFVENEVAIRLEDYTYALRKHGIKTVKGAISSVLDWQGLIGSTASALGAYTLSSNAILGAAAGASIMIGKIAVEIIEAKLNLDDIKRGENSEVAFVHQVTELKQRGKA